ICLLDQHFNQHHQSILPIFTFNGDNIGYLGGEFIRLTLELLDNNGDSFAFFNTHAIPAPSICYPFPYVAPPSFMPAAAPPPLLLPDELLN
ncbi:hypothetical protein SOVF_201950, partial [Spinacia oleracea]